MQPTATPRTAATGALAPPSPVVIRRLEERDLVAADRILRLAFGAHLGLSDPLSFKGDGDCVRSRWRIEPSAAMVAEVDDAVVGSIFTTNWGSVGFPGPLSVHPTFWNRGVGRRLIQTSLERFARWNTTLVIFFTYGNSPRHVAWYQTLGLWPRYLTAVLERTALPPGNGRVEVETLSQVAEPDRQAVLAECRDVTDAVYSGLDLTSEIRAAATYRLGETVLLWDNSRLTGFAVCHYGAGTEARSGTCYIKFAAVRPGPSAARDLDALVDRCEATAVRAGLSRISVGVSTARREAYEQMLGRGYRIDILGVAMHRHNEIGYSRRGVYVLDDCR